jgi:hypothetical protein
MFCLVISLFAASINLTATATVPAWESDLVYVQNLINMDKKGKPVHGRREIIALRRSWVSIKEADLSHPAYERIRELLVIAYRNAGNKTLSDWYKSASLEEIDKKIKAKDLEGKTAFKDIWRARMDEFRMITVWRPDTVKEHQQPTVYYFKPGDEAYVDAATLSKLEPKQEKAVDFDLSAFALVTGPSRGPFDSMDW